MRSPVIGLHHVTATVGDAQPDLDFAVSALGLRLVKKTVNFDNHDVFHFYYGNESGTPGTIWTTFPYASKGVRAGTKGRGQITAVSFSVPARSLSFWKNRLHERGFAVSDLEARFGDEALVVTDPSGLAIELVATGRDERTPWTHDVAAHAAIRGIEAVTMTLESAAPTVAFMTQMLGFVVTNVANGRTRLAVDGDEPGKRMDIIEAPQAPAAVNGIGTVHHVAMGVPTADDQRRMRAELVRAGYRVTEVLDRQYFTSIYFREPGGVLFEIATVPPGFLIDEAPEALGGALKLPPWEEPYRSEIVTNLPAIVHP
jgi:glyoxalase family protein